MRAAIVTVALVLSGCAADSVARTPASAPAPQPIVKAAPVAAPAILAQFDRPAEQGGLVIGRVPPEVRAVQLDGRPVRLATDGAFIIGFHRDAPASARLLLLMADGRSVDQPITVAPRAYDIQKVDGLPPRTVTLSPADELRRKGEVAKIVAARSRTSDLQGWRQPFVWPARGRISGVFGSQRIRNGVPGSPHYGVDVARPAGTPVTAPGDGVVVLAEADMLLEGGLIIIDHGHDLFSDYMHLSRIDVKVGQSVKAGDSLGAIGATGRATGPHLHWGLKWGDARLDPARLIRATK